MKDLTGDDGNRHGLAPRAGRHFAFLLLPGFSHYSFASALEPLRSANVILGRDHFTWSLVGFEDRQVRASNGVTLVVDRLLGDLAQGGDIVVLSGHNPRREADRRLEGWLRYHFRQGGRIGAVSSGVVVVARTGLLDDRTCAAHWEDAPRIRDSFGRVRVTDSIYDLGDRISTCAGGAAAAHMMLAVIARDLGNGVVLDVAARMVLDRLRDGQDDLSLRPHVRYGTWNRAVLDSIALMNAHVSEPLQMREIARRIAVSTRHLERSFKAELGTTPKALYRQIRLSKARQLLLHSDLLLYEIAEICGFSAGQVFKRSYERAFGLSPRAERARRGAGSACTGKPGGLPILHPVNAES